MIDRNELLKEKTYDKEAQNSTSINLKPLFSKH